MTTNTDQNEIVPLQRMVWELEERWARRLMEKCGPTCDAMECGQALQLKECLDELRAVIAKLPNDKDQVRSGQRTATTNDDSNV